VASHRSDDQTVRIWEPTIGQARHILTGHTRAVTAMAVAPDGSWLATTSSDGTMRIWDVDTRASIAALRSGHPLNSAATDGSWISVAGDRGPYFLAMANGC
jgi:WD40 repeat protein